LGDFREDDVNRGVVGVARDFAPPADPPSHTGLLWKKKDGSLGMTITDVLNWPIHLIGTLEPGGVYYFRGWRGAVPGEMRIPLIDGPEPVLDNGEPKEED
jgi:hypothetical protein